MDTHTVDLNTKATQTAFGALVGVSQQAIAERVKASQLTADGTMGQWLYEYCEQLRKEAAGRSGKAQDELTHARIEEARENAASKKQQRLKDAGDLLLLGDIQNLLLELPMIVRTAVLQARDTIRDGLTSKHKLTLVDEDVDEPIGAALRLIADRALKLQQTFGVGGQGDSTETNSANGNLG